jgi:hypothetical protein
MTMITRSRTGLALLGASALCLALTACSSSGSSSGSGGAEGTPATASSAPSGSAGTTGGSTGTTTGGGGSTGSTTGGGSPAGAGPAACAGTQLTVTVGASDGAAGHIGVALLFHNTGASACTLYGYPGVAALDGGNQQVAQAQRTLRGYMGGAAPSVTQPSSVVVQSGGTVSARVEATDVPSGGATSCTTYAGLLVTPPGTRASTRLTAQLPGCSGLQVHPVVPGTTGDQE